MTIDQLPIRLIVNEREYALIRRLISKSLSAQPGTTTKRSKLHDGELSSEIQYDDHKAAAFRSASRVFVVTYGTLRTVGAVLDRLATRRSQTATRSRKPLVASHLRMALSLSSLLFFHATLYRIFVRLRLQLLHEKVRSIKERYPRIYAVLTSRIAPAIGASLSGLALGICPADQLRMTITIYVGCRALEIGYAAIEHTKLIQSKPSWVGSWILFALAQGQLLHALVFDRDCFPEAYRSFVIGYTPEYIQRPPPNLSVRVTWPTPDSIVDALAQMARLRWPPFVSPILHPKMANTLPASIDPIISPITSRAHPGIQNLSCALLHPSDPSCFLAYLRQMLLSFPEIAKFFTKYYGALALLRFKKVLEAPMASLNRLSESILRSTIAVAGSIGASWGTICLFQNILPRAFLPKFRFFLGGLLGGLFQLFDRTEAGHANSLYAARMSVDSLWKVGIKHRWWKGIRGGDVWVFVASLALVNVVYDLGKSTSAGQDRALSLIKVLRGEVELGLREKPETSTEATMTEEKATKT
ncbi:hypothetical protein G647_06688 [Cladophialophora carrionii CBS 160.54]|uniref:Transmembrane protein 135 N-terminal domain-containing protein n=1 Tax=Cladophialophora carrionii CBS 160.54 TaxID=1279043 RepID=V9D9H2_9EURO|nr:uncharacterized protein G647_06688 [Cladophialophora carrionii CBS 160.54]ETI22612.1 hypothetical protein G647_06688 [Cladophialophora carrionii CBS 160.54]